MLHDILFLIIGLALIMGGGNYVTNGAVAIAGKFKLSPMLVGLTIVAFGSSTPDLAVSLISTIHGKSALAVGNILGAVIFDILMVVGLMSVIRPIKLSKSALWVDLPVLALGTLILLFSAEGRLIDGHGYDELSRADGLVLLLVFVGFMMYTIANSRKPELAPERGATQGKPREMKLWVAVVCVVLGLGALVLGGEWTVNAASGIARRAGMSEALIGLTIVGIGSSLPDLATSLIATFKGESSLALGNIIGSCIMDAIMVLGTCAVVKPLGMNGISAFDFIALAGSAILLFVMGVTKRRLSRAEGVVLILLYGAYVGHLVGASI